MGEAIAIASGKGGVGKSQAAINLGAALALSGKKVIIVDANVVTPDISLYLSVKSDKKLNDVLSGKAEAGEAVCKYMNTGLNIMPANPHITAVKTINTEAFAALLKQLKKTYNIVLIDTSPGLDQNVVKTMSQADKVVLVANPEQVSLIDAFKTAALTEAAKKPIRGVILNRMGRFKGEAGREEIHTAFEEIKILGRVPEDDSVPISAGNQEPVVMAFPHSPSARAFKRIAARLVGESYEENSFLENMMHLLRMR